MPPVDQPCCATCLYWTGKCQRRAPTVVAYVRMADGVRILEAVWPKTAADDVCGDWARNPINPSGNL